MATIPFNLVFCLFVGLCFAACARTQLLSGAVPWRNDLLGLVLSFPLVTVAPAAVYLYLVYPEWSWMYLADPARLPLGTGLAVLVLTLLMVPVGYLMGWLVLRVASGRGLFAVIGALGAAVLMIVFVSHQRLFYLGRLEDFRHGGGLMKPITQGKLFFALLCTTPLCLAAAALVGRSLWVQGRWLRQQAASASLRTGDHQPLRSNPGTPPDAKRAHSKPPSRA